MPGNGLGVTRMWDETQGLLLTKIQRPKPQAVVAALPPA